MAKVIAPYGPPCSLKACQFGYGSGRKWFGTCEGDYSFIICQECNEWNVKGTPLEGALGRDITAVVYTMPGRAQACYLSGSPRCRAELAKAVEMGNANYFLQFWRARVDFSTSRRIQTKQLFQAQAMQHQAQMMAQLSKGSALINATILSGGASVAEIMGEDDGSRYGNHQVSVTFFSITYFLIAICFSYQKLFILTQYSP